MTWDFGRPTFALLLAALVLDAPARAVGDAFAAELRDIGFDTLTPMAQRAAVLMDRLTR